MSATAPCNWTCSRCKTRVAAHLPHSCSETADENVYDRHFREALVHRVQALESALNGANIRETASMEVRRLVGSPHALGSLADRVVALEERQANVDADLIRGVVREEMEDALERALGSLLQGLLAGKFPQYRETDPDTREAWEDLRG